jgi:tryptophan-rich sensory protein
MKKVKQAGLALLFICIAFLPALGALLVQTDGWYEQLNKPLWNPPAYLFGPVWTVLYFMIGLAGYFAWTRGSRAERRAVFTVYGAQLVVNALWTPLFFRLHRPDWSLASLVMLWFLILLCIGVFSRRSRLAAWLLMPYFLWGSFAGALNAAIMVIN